MVKRAEFRVTGEVKIHCGGCEQRIDFALRRFGGVRAVRASAKTQEIAVEFEPEKMTPAEIQQRLEQIGYEVEPASQET